MTSKRADPISRNLFAWPMAIYRADYRAIQRANGLDSYFFVRFLRFMARLFLPIWFLTWAVLLPITSINTHTGNNTGLDRLTFGNIQPSLSARYAAHVVIAYIIAGKSYQLHCYRTILTFCVAWVCYGIKEEMAHFLAKRQEHLVNPVHARSVQANTVLITGIPPDYISVRALTRLFGNLPGGVKKVWINRRVKLI
jgi:calcium permeable stress-gated cation channel